MKKSKESTQRVSRMLVMHFCRSKRIDFDGVIDSARNHFTTERHEEVA